MTMEWKKDFEVGLHDIDEQHKELFNIINNLMESINSGRGRQEIEKVLKFLQDYVVDHFKKEEGYMKKFNYPGYANHKDQHDLFIANYNSINRFFEAWGASDGLVDMINRWVSNWLSDHILKVDKELGNFISAKI